MEKETAMEIRAMAKRTNNGFLYKHPIFEYKKRQSKFTIAFFYFYILESLI
jgi:hypothetical protein